MFAPILPTPTKPMFTRSFSLSCRAKSRHLSPCLSRCARHSKRFLDSARNDRIGDADQTSGVAREERIVPFFFSDRRERSVPRANDRLVRQRYNFPAIFSD